MAVIWNEKNESHTVKQSGVVIYVVQKSDFRLDRINQEAEKDIAEKIPVKYKDEKRSYVEVISKPTTTDRETELRYLIINGPENAKPLPYVELPDFEWPKDRKKLLPITRILI